MSQLSKILVVICVFLALSACGKKERIETSSQNANQATASKVIQNEEVTGHSGFDLSEAEIAQGKELYSQCAACHLDTGAGVPGAFPALAGQIDKLASTPSGRQYLVSLVKHGLQGQIETPNGNFNGVMTAIGGGWSDDDIAAVLNHTLTTFGDGDASMFSTGEISKILNTTEIKSPHDVAKLRPVNN